MRSLFTKTGIGLIFSGVYIVYLTIRYGIYIWQRYFEGEDDAHRPDMSVFTKIFLGMSLVIAVYYIFWFIFKMTG